MEAKKGDKSWAVAEKKKKEGEGRCLEKLQLILNEWGARAKNDTLWKVGQLRLMRMALEYSSTTSYLEERGKKEGQGRTTSS